MDLTGLMAQRPAGTHGTAEQAALAQRIDAALGAGWRAQLGVRTWA
jgi:hypothetical protein